MSTGWIRKLRASVAIASVAAATPGLTAAAGAGGVRPNFLVFIADDQSHGDVGLDGTGAVRTPHLRALAGEGLRFTHAFVASPSCGPSRTAFLTGLWPARNGAERNHQPRRAGIPGLIPQLQGLGYEVAAIGKVAHADWAKTYGFDFTGGVRRGFEDASEIESFLRTRRTERPLCLLVGTRHPHTPWGDSAGYDPAAIELPPTHVDTAETRTMRARYLADVTRADALLGRVRGLVSAHVPGETVCVYTADNGGQWPFGKWNLYDAGIRVPLVIAWPGRIATGASSTAMVCWPDLLPTLIELAGGTVPAGLDGKSFAAVLRGAAADHRDRVFATHSGDGDFNVYPMRSVRTRGWKYIRNLYPEFQHHSHISRAEGAEGIVYWRSWLAAARSDAGAAAIMRRAAERPAEELYDLNADPFETRNLAEDPRHAAVLAGLRRDLDEWMRSQEDQRTVFGVPLRRGEPVTPVVPAAAKKAGR